MIWFKFFLLFLSCFLFRGIWTRLVDFFVRKPAPESSIPKMVIYSAIQQVFQPSVDNALVIPWLQMRARENSKQVWLVKLGLSALAGFILLVLIWFWIYFLGLRLTFIELSHLQRLAEPPAWSIWLGDQSPVTFFGMAVFGIATTLFWRRPFFNVAIAGILVFAGLISVAGAIVMLLAERLALKFVFRWKHNGEMLKNEVHWSLLFSTLILAASILWGRWLVTLVSQLGFENTFHPADRFELLTVTLLLWSLAEVVVSMAFFHFYWLKYRQA